MADCTRAPAGWYCKRKGGHPGPCPTVPRWWNVAAHLRWWLFRG